MATKIKKGAPLSLLEKNGYLPSQGQVKFATLVFENYREVNRLLGKLKDPINLYTRVDGFDQKERTLRQILIILNKGWIDEYSYDHAVNHLIDIGLLGYDQAGNLVAAVDFTAISEYEFNQDIAKELDKLTSTTIQLTKEQRDSIGMDVKKLLW